jgi:predicted ATPase/DNA-binding winged helix-turn-helix (wHTH) protein/tetratricopeptide (TPR) repeat protein
MRTVYELGPFRLDTEARVLTQDGVATELGARGVAVLAALVSRAGEYVDKSAIMDAAWPGLVVDENNLAVQISAIRRVLARVRDGTRWIETLPRRGYRFVGPVVEIHGTPSPPVTAGREHTNLPQLLQSFIGRERELAEIKQLLPGTRLLTLTGTGGIGKTRLALQAAAEARDAYRDGVWFVDLAPLVDPGLVPSALAQVLGVKESVGQPLVKTLSDHLRPLKVLVVLDNCEHLLDACARLAETLLRESAGGTLVATSREPLRIGAERTYPLGALSLPDPHGDAQSIAQSDSVRLFVDRARQHRPGFDLQDQRARAVAEICVRLDGIPLALELAAARMAVLPVEQIVRLLDQRFRLLASGSRSDLPRHQTLRALLDWSYELLDEAERQFFARLSVFAGGWTLAAAEVVGAEGVIAKDDVVYLLIALVEKSLVVADDDGDRYRMLETVREYAREKLVISEGANAVRERHRNFFLALAVSAEPNLAGPEQATWLQRLEDEHDNLRSALEYCLVAASGSDAGLRLCGALHWFWIMRGHRAEGLDWCVRVLGIEGIGKRTSERAMALQAAGLLAYHLGDFPAARAYHEDSLAMARELSDQKGVARAAIFLGNLRLRQGDPAAAQALSEEGLAISRNLEDPWLTQQSLNVLGNVAAGMGEYPMAKSLYEESLAIARERADRVRIAILLNNLGYLTFERGEYSIARALHEESLAIRRELKDSGGIAYSLSGLGDVALQQGDYSAASAFVKDALCIRRELGDKMGIAELLEKQAAVVGAIGNALHAAHIGGAAERLREEIGSPLTPGERLRHDRHMAAARAALGDDAAFNRAWQEGRTLSPEQAIEISLEALVDRG